ncbi:hypothetical protein QAD02_016096 [Eretmocerus hayati]|uniref:Uncharacterized protein n=1 Tax=Eretmocerus hayati TaxID=131215 RepID=A0ACC2PAI5_9HYME|nr:hypothetical protein QAD02_016096 [Eretmocerus hayati]
MKSSSSRRLNLASCQLKLSKILEMDPESPMKISEYSATSSPLTPITSIARDLSRSSLSSNDTPVRAPRSTVPDKLDHLYHFDTFELSRAVRSQAINESIADGDSNSEVRF